jgi:hypothetical protein
MLKITLFTALMVLIVNTGNCQNTISDDKNEIYKNVVNMLKKDGEKFTVKDFTKKSVFSNFDFNDGGRGIDTISNKVWNKKEWIAFIKSIDTASITDYSLNIKPSKKRAKTQITFAPIMFSKENDKALCIGQLYSLSSGQVTAWYYQKEKAIWILKGWQVFSYID